MMISVNFNKMAYICFIILLIFCMKSDTCYCKMSDGEIEEEKSTANKNTLCVESFDFLEIGMSYQEVINVVGVPDEGTKSDVVIVRYHLKDGSRVTLVFGTTGQSLENAIWEKLNGEMVCILQTVKNRSLCIENFNFLKIGMSYQKVIDVVGVPDDMAGSGVIKVKYFLKDGSNVILNFGTTGLKLKGATWEKANGERIAILK